MRDGSVMRVFKLRLVQYVRQFDVVNEGDITVGLSLAGGSANLLWGEDRWSTINGCQKNRIEYNCPLIIYEQINIINIVN